MWKKILKMLDLDDSKKYAEMFLVSKGNTLFNAREALQWVDANIEHAIPNIMHGHGGPALRVLLQYRKRRELKAVIKAIKAKYNVPQHLVTCK